MVKDGLLKYGYPEDEDAPNQAYLACGDPQKLKN